MNNMPIKMQMLRAPNRVELRELQEELAGIEAKYAALTGEQYNDTGFLETSGPSIFENFVGILLAREHPIVEHQYRVDGMGGFRVADYFVEDEQERAKIVEVKSGNRFQEESIGQFEDLLRRGLPLEIIVRPNMPRIKQHIKQLVRGRNVIVTSTDEMASYQALMEIDQTLGEKSGTVLDVLSSKEALDGLYIDHEVDLAKLERDVHSIFLWANKYDLTDQEIIDGLTGALSQDEEYQTLITEEHGLELMTQERYDETLLVPEIFTPHDGRIYDPQLHEIKLRKRIEDIEREVELLIDENPYNEVAVQERKVGAKTGGAEAYGMRVENWDHLRRIIEGVPPELASHMTSPVTLVEVGKEDMSLFVVCEDEEIDPIVFEVLNDGRNKQVLELLADKGTIRRKREKFFKPEVDPLPI